MSWIREANSEPIPGYRLIEPIGSGGFGEVWKCEAPGGLNKAVKFVYGNLRSADIDCVRAEQEYRALQRVKEVRHPFICSLELIKEIEGELVIVMELADRTLHDLCQDCISAGMTGIPRNDLMRYLRDAAEALDYMNEKHNLQHLDVKPKNLFLIGDRLKVADFGLVKHLERQTSGMLGGVTPLYASPETFSGKISPHSDQYSLAIVYMEMLTGQRPFAAKNVRQLAQAHMLEEPDLRPLTEAERPILAKALAKDPQKRFSNCMAFVSALYKARKHVKHAAEAPVDVPGAVVGTKVRSRSLAETMEDMSLDPIESVPGVPAALALAEPPAASDEEVHLGEPSHGDLGVTVPQPDTGALRPTLLIGLGTFGCKALLEMRCRLLDRFGDLAKLPIIRFLNIDPDPQAERHAVRGAPQVALTRNELYHLPLQPVGNYRKRNLEHLSDWLPREKLYSMSRALQTQGSRALGRLAFADNQTRLAGRLKRELQEITNADRIYEAVTQTGLALRDPTPRVYVLAPAGGGSSGLLPDLGFALHRVMRQLGHPEAVAHLMLLCGAPLDPATPKQELANLYATLTELNHFNDDAVSFSAQYGPDAQRFVEQGTPFDSVYLLPMENRTPEAFDETVAHLGNFLFHELTTPLGLRMDLRRTAQADAGHAAAFRSFGTFAVWFPRGLLLHQAARQACRDILGRWISNESARIDDEALAAIDAHVRLATSIPEYAGDRLIQQIERHASNGAGPTEQMQTPGECLAAMLAKFEEQLHQPVAQDDPTNWAKQVLARIRDYLGSGEGESSVGEWCKTKVTRTLMVASGKVADEWGARWLSDLARLMEGPGPRLVAVEAALGQLQQWIQTESKKYADLVAQHAARSKQTWSQVESALVECAGGGGFRLFGGRSKARQLRAFLDHLSHFSRSRMQEEMAHAAKQALTHLAGKLTDQARDLGFCRQRLRHLMDNLDFAHVGDEEDTVTGDGSHSSHDGSPDAFWEVIRQSATARVVLPDGETDLERCAERLLAAIHPDQWQQIDRELTERVLAPRGGLHSACINTGDLVKHLALPMLQEATALLGEYLPTMDVAEILGAEWSEQGSGDESAASAWMREYLDRACPALLSQATGADQAFLLVPASAAGGELAAKAAVAHPELELVRVPGQGDLMFLREEGKIETRDLQRWLKPARAAYESSTHVPSMSPHARFDLQDWTPLNP